MLSKRAKTTSETKPLDIFDVTQAHLVQVHGVCDI